jgi:hypothetical protein
MHPGAEPYEERWAERPHRRARHVVSLIEQILGGNKNFQTPRHWARREGVQREVAAEPKTVLVIVKLIPPSPSLKGQSHRRRM